MERESNEYHDRGGHYRLSEKPGARENPRNPQGRSQLKLLAIVERMSDA